MPRRWFRTAAARLDAGGLALGFGVHHLRGSASGLIAAAISFDRLSIDMEHGALGVVEAAQIAIAALSQGLTPIARICEDALSDGTRCLDNGARGVIVPHVDTPEEAAEVAGAFRFPPLGTRSWGGQPFAHGFGAVPPAEGKGDLNAGILVACMVETPEAAAHAEAIAAKPGEDVLMFGPSDLTATMGIPGQISHPKARAACARVDAACARHGKVLGMGGVYGEATARDDINLGARFVLAGSDHAFRMAGAAVRARLLRDRRPG